MDNTERVPLPLWYINNDGDIYFNIADIIVRKKISLIVVWYPSKQEDIKAKIDKFIKALSFTIDPESTHIEKINEDYSTVWAGEVVSNFKKNVASDTVSAMILLERYKSKHQ